MKLQSVLVAIGLIVAGGLIGSMITPSVSAQSNQIAYQAGKFQMVVVSPADNKNNNTHIYLLNTSTGQCWQGQPGSGGWNDLKSPNQ